MAVRRFIHMGNYHDQLFQRQDCSFSATCAQSRFLPIKTIWLSRSPYFSSQVFSISGYARLVRFCSSSGNAARQLETSVIAAMQSLSDSFDSIKFIATNSVNSRNLDEIVSAPFIYAVRCS